MKKQKLIEQETFSTPVFSNGADEPDRSIALGDDVQRSFLNLYFAAVPDSDHLDWLPIFIIVRIISAIVSICALVHLGVLELLLEVFFVIT